MKFSNIEEIKKHFELSAYSINDLKYQLLEIVKKIHPDKNGGSFRTKADENYFHEIQEAIDFLENTNNLPATRQELSLITQVLKELIPVTQIKKSENYLILENKVQSSIKLYRSKHLFPKISTSILALVMTTIWLFPKSAIEHPVLKHYLTPDTAIFGILWLFSLFVCAITWLIVKVIEKRDEELKKGLTLDTNLNKLFTRFTEYRYYGKIEDGYFYFNKDELIEFIIEYDFKRNRIRIKKFKKLIWDLYSEFIMRLIPLDRVIELDLAQTISDVIIDKGLQKKVIEKVDSFSINDTFRTKALERNFPISSPPPPPPPTVSDDY